MELDMSDPKRNGSRAAGMGSVRPVGRTRMSHPRSAMRVRPRPVDGVLAAIKDDNGTITGRVRDLSTDGVGVYVDSCIALGATVIVCGALPE